MKLSIGLLRHAIAVSEWDEQKSVIDLLDAARDALMVWALERMRDDLILALTQVTTDGSGAVPYASATTGQRDAWQADNVDRVLFGAAISNTAGTHAGSLANLDGTADKMSTDVIELAKRRAMLANPRIRPINVRTDGTEWFVLFVNPYQMRDLKKDTRMVNGLTYAMERGRENPLFSGGDLIWENVIIREIPELPTIAGAGAGSINVAPALLCGAQALGIAWAQRTTTTTNVRDYGHFHGVGIKEMRGIGKLRFGKHATTDDADPVDQGMVTIFTASVADA
jgi:N4-gp56 family major capsid protein